MNIEQMIKNIVNIEKGEGLQKMVNNDNIIKVCANNVN